MDIINRRVRLGVRSSNLSISNKAHTCRSVQETIMMVLQQEELMSLCELANIPDIVDLSAPLAVLVTYIEEVQKWVEELIERFGDWLMCKVIEVHEGAIEVIRNPTSKMLKLHKLQWVL